MGTWSAMTPKQKAAAGDLFAALTHLDALADAGKASADEARRVGFSDLYDYATRTERAMDERLREALDGNARLRDDLVRLLDRVSVYHFPRVAAASSGDAEGREGDGFSIRMRRSRAVESQTYVIIELAEALDETPKTLFLCGPRQQYAKYALPDPQERTIQLLVDSDSDLVAALKDVKMEVFLR